MQFIECKRKHLEMCKVGMSSEATFAAGQGRQRVRGVPGTTPPDASPSNLLRPGSGSRFIFLLRLPLLAALQGSSPWPQQALGPCGLGGPGGSSPPWQLDFALLSTNKTKPPSRAKRAAVVCQGCFWVVSSSAALLFPLHLSPSKRL